MKGKGTENTNMPILLSGVRVMRGMVFRYCLDETVNKKNPPDIEVGNKMVKDWRQHGVRDWLVVSSNDHNNNRRTCCIVPISSAKTYRGSKVDFYYENTLLQIICEQIYTVNTGELEEYRYMLSEQLMDDVSEKLAEHLDLKQRDRYTTEIKSSMSRIEEIINDFIYRRIYEIEAERTGNVGIEEAIERIGDGLEKLLDSHFPKKAEVTSGDDEEYCVSEENSEDSGVEQDDESMDCISEDDNCDISQIEKFFTKYPNLKENKYESKKNREKKSTSKKKREENYEKRHPKRVTLELKSTKEVERETKEKIELAKKAEVKVDNQSVEVNSEVSKAEVKTEASKAEVKVEKTKKAGKPRKTDRVYRNWTESSMREFISDMETVPVTDMLKKWNFDTVANMYKTRYYVMSKLNKIDKERENS